MNRTIRIRVIVTGAAALLAAGTVTVASASTTTSQSQAAPSPTPTAPGAPSASTAPSASPAPSSSSPAGAAACATPNLPGAKDAITDVPGVEVGQVQSTAAPYLTGDTEVYFPNMSVASVSQMGGAPATKETDLLNPLNSNPGVNVIQLGGSSMYGLGATDGAIRWVEDHNQGVNVGVGTAPIVPAADIFDLGRGGNIMARTSAPWGYLAVDHASAGPVREGVVGGGTGADSGRLKSGTGTASECLPDGYWIGAVVVVNSSGSPVNPNDCTLLAADLGLGSEFAGLRAPAASECQATSAASGTSSMNTTIAVVATNAPLEKSAAERLAENSADGMARAINPIHTLADGDTVFGVSTGSGTALANNNAADEGVLDQLFTAGANTLSRAIVKAILTATSTSSTKSYCDTYPDACANMPQLQTWRTEGQDVTATQRLLNQATAKLAVLPVPSS